VPDPALRIIDANANRAREALRTLEDLARFALNDESLTERLKRMRHDLGGTLRPLDASGELLAARDTPGDVGARISTEAEGARTGLVDVATAAGKRLTEALRCIEEAFKILAAAGRPGVKSAGAADVERVRYEAYEIEKAIRLALLGRRGGFRGWRLCLLLSESLCAGRDPLDVAARAIEGGADCVQVREKQMEAGALLERARAVVALCRERGAAAIVNDRPDVALLADADGAHLGQTDLPVAEARRILGEGRLVGASTATIEQARASAASGADVCGVGPMFPSGTKPKESLAGPAYLRAYLSHAPPLPPALAISGITPGRVGDLIEASGGRRFGLAASSFICAADDPERAARSLREAIDPLWSEG